MIKIDNGADKIINILQSQGYEAYERCCNHSDYMKKQDREMLFRMLNKYIEHWWD